MNPYWEMRLWTDDNLLPSLNRNAWAACGNVGGTPSCVMRSDILRPARRDVPARGASMGGL